MKKVRRTTAFDSVDHNLIVAAGESDQTDCAAFIEQQKKILLECQRSKVAVSTEGGVTRKSNDEGTDGGIKMNFRDDHHRSTFSTGDLKNPPTLTGQPGLSNVGGRSYFGFVSLDKEDYVEPMQKSGKGRSVRVLGVFYGRKIWFLDLKDSFVIGCY